MALNLGQLAAGMAAAAARAAAQRPPAQALDNLAGGFGYTPPPPAPSYDWVPPPRNNAALDVAAQQDWAPVYVPPPPPPPPSTFQRAMMAAADRALSGPSFAPPAPTPFGNLNVGQALGRQLPAVLQSAIPPIPAAPIIPLRPLGYGAVDDAARMAGRFSNGGSIDTPLQPNDTYVRMVSTNERDKQGQPVQVIVTQTDFDTYYKNDPRYAKQEQAKGSALAGRGYTTYAKVVPNAGISEPEIKPGIDQPATVTPKATPIDTGAPPPPANMEHVFIPSTPQPGTEYVVLEDSQHTDASGMPQTLIVTKDDYERVYKLDPRYREMGPVKGENAAKMGLMLTHPTAAQETQGEIARTPSPLAPTEIKDNIDETAAKIREKVIKNAPAVIDWIDKNVKTYPADIAHDIWTLVGNEWDGWKNFVTQMAHGDVTGALKTAIATQMTASINMVQVITPKELDEPVARLLPETINYLSDKVKETQYNAIVKLQTGQPLSKTDQAALALIGGGEVMEWLFPILASGRLPTQADINDFLLSGGRAPVPGTGGLLARTVKLGVDVSPVDFGMWLLEHPEKVKEVQAKGGDWRDLWELYQGETTGGGVTGVLKRAARDVFIDPLSYIPIGEVIFEGISGSLKAASLVAKTERRASLLMKAGKGAEVVERGLRITDSAAALGLDQQLSLVGKAVARTGVLKPHATEARKITGAEFEKRGGEVLSRSQQQDRPRVANEAVDRAQQQPEPDRQTVKVNESVVYTESEHGGIQITRTADGQWQVERRVVNAETGDVTVTKEHPTDWATAKQQAEAVRLETGDPANAIRLGHPEGAPIANALHPDRWNPNPARNRVIDQIYEQNPELAQRILRDEAEELQGAAERQAERGRGEPTADAAIQTSADVSRIVDIAKAADPSIHVTFEKSAKGRINPVFAATEDVIHDPWDTTKAAQDYLYGVEGYQLANGTTPPAPSGQVMWPGTLRPGASADEIAAANRYVDIMQQHAVWNPNDLNNPDFVREYNRANALEGELSRGGLRSNPTAPRRSTQVGQGTRASSAAYPGPVQSTAVPNVQTPPPPRPAPMPRQRADVPAQAARETLGGYEVIPAETLMDNARVVRLDSDTAAVVSPAGRRAKAPDVWVQAEGANPVWYTGELFELVDDQLGRAVRNADSVWAHTDELATRLSAEQARRLGLIEATPDAEAGRMLDAAGIGTQATEGAPTGATPTEAAPAQAAQQPAPAQPAVAQAAPTQAAAPEPVTPTEAAPTNAALTEQPTPAREAAPAPATPPAEAAPAPDVTAIARQVWPSEPKITSSNPNVPDKPRQQTATIWRQAKEAPTLADAQRIFDDYAEGKYGPRDKAMHPDGRVNRQGELVNPDRMVYDTTTAGNGWKIVDGWKAGIERDWEQMRGTPARDAAPTNAAPTEAAPAPATPPAEAAPAPETPPAEPVKHPVTPEEVRAAPAPDIPQTEIDRAFTGYHQDGTDARGGWIAVKESRRGPEVGRVRRVVGADGKPSFEVRTDDLRLAAQLKNELGDRVEILSTPVNPVHPQPGEIPPPPKPIRPKETVPATAANSERLFPETLQRTGEVAPEADLYLMDIPITHDERAFFTQHKFENGETVLERANRYYEAARKRYPDGSADSQGIAAMSRVYDEYRTLLEQLYPAKEAPRAIKPVLNFIDTYMKHRRQRALQSWTKVVSFPAIQAIGNATTLTAMGHPWELGTYVGAWHASRNAEVLNAAKRARVYKEGQAAERAVEARRANNPNAKPTRTEQRAIDAAKGISKKPPEWWEVDPALSPLDRLDATVGTRRGREITHIDLGLGRPGEKLVVEQIFGKLHPGLGKGIGRISGQEWGLKQGARWDRAMRETLIYGEKVQRYPLAVKDFRNHLIERLRKDGLEDTAIDGIWRDLTGRRENGLFNLDDVVDAVKKGGGNEGTGVRLGRDWQGTVNKIDADARAKMNKIAFGAGETRADLVMRRLMLFHYFFTRQSWLYLTTAAKHPAMLHMYFELSEAMDKYSEKLPDGMKGWLQLFTTPVGFSLFLRPQNMMQTLLSFQENASGYVSSGETKVGGIIQMLNDTLGLAPWIADGANLAGLMGNTFAPDPSAYWPEANLVTLAINWARYNGLMGGDRPIGNPLTDMNSKLREEVSGLFGEAKKVRAQSDTEMTDRKIQQLILAEAEAQGLDPEKDYDQINAAMHDPDNPLYKAAFKKYLQGETAKVGARFLLGPFRPKVETLDAKGNFIKELGKWSEDMTPRQRAERDLTITTNKEAAMLLQQQRHWYELTPERKSPVDMDKREVYAVYNEVAYGTPIMNVIVNGKTYTPAQMNKMTHEQRVKLANALLQENGLLDDYQRIKDAQDAFLADPKNKEYAQYRTWQKQIRDDGLEAYWQELSAKNPNARAYYTKVMGDPRLTPEEQQNRLTSIYAWMAVNGIQPDYNDPIPMSTGKNGPFDPTGIAGTPAKPTVKEPPKWETDLRTDLPKFEAKYETWDEKTRIVMADWGIDPNTPFNTLPTKTRTAIEKEVKARYEISEPTQSAPVKDYIKWAEKQPEGADLSIEAYLADNDEAYRRRSTAVFEDSMKPKPEVGTTDFYTRLEDLLNQHDHQRYK